MHKAIITSVYRGIESTTEIEDDSIIHLYAKVAGAVEGITAFGSAITRLTLDRESA